MAPGFLIVFSEPGAKVTLDEFQDWYNNEHVPLRMNELKSFLTGARFHAPDSQSPSWVALYDIDDTATFSHPSYTRLRANRSPREADLVKRLEVLDRRTCVFLKDSGPSILSTGLKSENPTKWIVIQGVDVLDPNEKEQDRKFADWTEDVFLKVKGVDGWIRTRTFKCYDNLITGTVVEGKGPEAQKVPKYLLVHELLSADAADTPAFKVATAEIEASIAVLENRKWELYRAYPGIAQGNLP